MKEPIRFQACSFGEQGEEIEWLTQVVIPPKSFILR